MNYTFILACIVLPESYTIYCQFWCETMYLRFHWL